LEEKWISVSSPFALPQNDLYLQIEGFVTVICGVIGFFILPSSIEKVKILTEVEKV
jgi:hypothetical protein